MSRGSRREFLRRGLVGAGVVAGGRLATGCNDGSGDGSDAGSHPTGGDAATADSPLAGVGPLQDPDENGLRLPEGFTSRIVARTGKAPVKGGSYLWHLAPDGGATFTTGDGGWIYVSNCEATPGGVGALRFDADGALVDAYAIGSPAMARNCAGGPTPWGTWITCEEHDTGRAWECDPTGERPAVALPALGIYRHEAVAVDPATFQLYLTEDKPDGRLYRFTPDGMTRGDVPDLRSGTLEVARVQGEGPDGAVVWLEVPDPSAAQMPTRAQVPESTPFDGGEGIWYREGVLYFTTKGDNRVWAYGIDDAELTRVYELATAEHPILSGVDNITASPAGDLLVAEDGGDMQVVVITPGGRVLPLVQVQGQDESEITGPAFDPSGTRLYFSSQRGEGPREGQDGITYEVSGPFFEP